VKEYPGRLVLLGHPLAQTLSPVFQNAALRAAHIPLVYEALDTTPPDLPQVLATLKKRNAAGNVTIPHKVAVHAACDDLTDIARRVGAVNTFWCEAGRLWGDNTDVGGFDAAARRLLGGAIPGARVALLGAGGSAAAASSAAALGVASRSMIGVSEDSDFGPSISNGLSVRMASRSRLVVYQAVTVICLPNR
jgi:shikimate dehydrogenase